GEVLFLASEPLLRDARAGAKGRGARALLDTFDRFNRSLADAPALLRFVESERDTALRIITSGAGTLQPRIVAAIQEVIDEEVRAGHYDPPVDTSTLAYAIVRLAEAFLFYDAVAGMRCDVDRLRVVEAALLAVLLPKSRHYPGVGDRGAGEAVGVARKCCAQEVVGGGVDEGNLVAAVTQELVGIAVAPVRLDARSEPEVLDARAPAVDDPREPPGLGQPS